MTDISVSSGNDFFIVSDNLSNALNQASFKDEIKLSDALVKPSPKVKTSLSGIFLSDVSEKDERWDTHKFKAEIVSKMYSECEEFYKRSVRIDNCSSLLEFNQIPDEQGDTSLKLSSADCCRCRQCPVCQWRRSLKWQARFIEALRVISGDFPKARFIFLTLTVRNCEITELRETLTWMNHAWKKLTLRSQFPAIGWVKCVEVTRNSDDETAHPHFHALLMVKSGYFGASYVSQKEWRSLWQDCLKVNYEPQVNVQAIKPVKGALDLSNGSLDSQMVKAILETSKYAVKEGDLVADREWLYELTRQLHKTRAIATGGIFKAYLSEKDMEPDDLVHISEDSSEETSEPSEDEARLRAAWRRKEQRYSMLSS
jgi:plasmid rolling circle replication initiator protein Rep